MEDRLLWFPAWWHYRNKLLLSLIVVIVLWDSAVRSSGVPRRFPPDNELSATRHQITRHRVNSLYQAGLAVGEPMISNRPLIGSSERNNTSDAPSSGATYCIFDDLK